MLTNTKSAQPTDAGLTAATRAIGNHPRQAAALGARVKQTQPATQSIAATDGAVISLPNAADPTSVIVDDATGVMVTIASDATTQVTQNSGLATAVDPATGAEQITQATPDSGVQILTVADNAAAAQATSFTFVIPASTHWVPQSSGALWLMNIDKPGPSPIMVIDAPWAVDANGVSLPTSYTVQGTKLIQTVDTAGAAFPVVVDPHSWLWRVGQGTLCVGEIGAFLFTAVKIVEAVSKVTTILKAARFATIAKKIASIGGAKALLTVIYNAARGIVSGGITKFITSEEFGVLSAVMGTVGGLITETLGVGACYSLIVDFL